MFQTKSEELIRDESVILDLLNNGKINLSRSIAKTMSKKEGVMQIRRVGLDKNNIQIRAAFRDKSIYINGKNNGHIKYYDAYYNELAAYVIARYLGLNMIPITVLRNILISASRLKPAPSIEVRELIKDIVS